jgi:hypothetical protein
MAVPLSRKITAFISIYRKRGVDGLLDAVAWSIPHWLFYYAHTMLVHSDRPAWKGSPVDGYKMRPVQADDIRYLAKDGFTDKKIVDRLKAGDKGLLMEKNDEVHSIVWAASGKKYLKLAGTEFDAGRDGFIWYGAYTDETVRRIGLFYNLGEEIYNIYSSQGMSKAWAAISANNSYWLEKVCAKMNFKIVGETYYLKFLFFNVCYYKCWPQPTKRMRIFFRNPPKHLSWI